MKKYMLREIYDIGTLSKDESWEKVYKAFINLNLSEPIIIDFKGVKVMEPWTRLHFKKLLSHENVGKMIMHNNEDTVNKIKVMCMLDGLSEDKIENVVIEVARVKTAHELKVEKAGNEIYDLIEESEHGYIIDMSKKYSQIQNSKSIYYVEYAIDRLIKEKGAKEAIIKIGNMYISDEALSYIAVRIVKKASTGFKLSVDIDNEERIKKMGLYLHKASAETLDTEEKIKCTKDLLEVNTPGLLIKYKVTRAIDEFGRRGKGEPVSSRIAIFRGYVDSRYDEECKLVFEVFKESKFYTAQHWMVEHDNEIPSKLSSEILEISIDRIGIGNMFLGSDYHFIEPIQKNISESRDVITGMDESGRNEHKLCTIPERIKYVLDDWNIEYNKKALENYIERTNKELGI